MGLPQLETCCFVFDLKTGNIVLGCMNAVFSFVLTITMTVITCMLEPPEPDFTKPRDLNLEAAETGAYVMSIILILMFLTKFCFDVVFVYGVITEKAGVIRAYFIMWVVFTLLSMFTFFLNSHHYNAGAISMEVFYIGLNIYAVLLSHSFYKVLNTREEV